jgi:hypothetical protein
MDAVLELKLREMLDRHEIWQVLQRYGRGLDRFDRELVRSCYFDDAIEDHFNFVGYVEDFIDYADRASGYFISCQHGLLNHSCELRGDDAYCETYFMFTGVAAKPPHLLSQGRYIDHFQRRNGEWRIANRVAIVEGTFDLFDSQLAATPSKYKPEERQPATRDRSDVSYHRPPRPRLPRD